MDKGAYLALVPDGQPGKAPRQQEAHNNGSRGAQHEAHIRYLTDVGACHALKQLEGQTDVIQICTDLVDKGVVDHVLSFQYGTCCHHQKQRQCVLDAEDQIIGYQFVSLGKFTDFVKAGDTPNEAYEKSCGQYGRVADAVKLIDPRTDKEIEK